MYGFLLNFCGNRLHYLFQRCSLEKPEQNPVEVTVKVEPNLRWFVGFSTLPNASVLVQEADIVLARCSSTSGT